MYNVHKKTRKCNLNNDVVIFVGGEDRQLELRGDCTLDVHNVQRIFFVHHHLMIYHYAMVYLQLNFGPVSTKK